MNAKCREIALYQLAVRLKSTDNINGVLYIALRLRLHLSDDNEDNTKGASHVSSKWWQVQTRNIYACNDDWRYKVLNFLKHAM